MLDFVVVFVDFVDHYCCTSVCTLVAFVVVPARCNNGFS